MAIAIAKPDRITMSKHDVVRAELPPSTWTDGSCRSSGIRICKILEIWGIALLDVVETHGRRSLPGGNSRRRIFGAEVCRLWLAVELRGRTRSSRYFPPTGTNRASQPEGL